MKAVVAADAEAAARGAASFLAGEARTAARHRGRFLLALSGGATPMRMLELLVEEDIPWPLVHLFQTDERIVAASDPGRNFSRLRACLLDHVPLPADQVHPMPVEAADLATAGAQYAANLRDLAGSPPVLDLVHLGLGEDGHTASLVPGDPVLEVLGSDVALTLPYQGFRRMTLTFPMLGRARRLLWLVTGPAKAEALQRLRRGDPTIPGGCVPPWHAVLFADRLADGAPAGHDSA